MKCGGKCHKVVDKIRRKEADDAMLMGTYNHTLDTKWRLIMPARLREELGDTFIITKSLDHCLSAYPQKSWEEFIGKLSELPKISSEPARRLRRFYFGNSAEMEVDKQGRILLPQALREYADLTKDVTLIGVQDHVEIWDTETWNRYNEETDAGDLMFDLSGLNL